MTVNEAGSSIWNISDIEGDSENWTLSSDVNMLNLLQTFSDNLLSNLNTSSRALEELITFSAEVSTKVNNTFNEFNMLSNAQFIESRVYEDDETHDVGSDILPDVKEEDTSDVIGARIKTSVEYGLTVLDAAYSVHGYSANSPDDTVEDADEDEEIIIEPNDPYTHRSLPYLIGSSEYCTDESVGITLLYQSDDESNKSEDEEDDDDDDDEEEEDEEEEEEDGDANLPKTATQVLESYEESDEDSEAETEVRPAAGVAVPRLPQLPNLRVPSSSESEEMFPETKSARTKVFDSIFDSTDEESEEEEDTKPPAPTPNNPSTSNSTAVTREERSPSVLSVKSNKTPKGVPKGAISIFGGRTVFEGGAIKVIEDEESGGKETYAPLADPGSEDDEIRPPKTATVKKVKKIDSIFSDTDESDSEGLFATKNIQDNDKEVNTVVSSTNKKTKSVPQKQAAVKPGSLFDFTSDEEDDMQPKKPMTPKSAGPSKESSSKGAQKASHFDLFDSNESDDDLQEEIKPAPAVQKKSNPAPPKKEEKGLFDSSDEETDTSLFGSVKVLPTPGKKLPDLKKETPQKKEKAKKEDSFDQLFASSDDDQSTSPQLPSTPSKSNSSKPSNNVQTSKTSIVSDKPATRAAKFDDIFGDSDEDDDDTFGFSAAPQKPGKSTVPEQPQVVDNNKKDVPKSPAKTKADKFDDLFADSDDETEDIFSGTEENKNKQKQQSEPANPLKDEPKKNDSKETAGKQTSSIKQEEKPANPQADKLKARAAKFDDIFGDSDDDEDDNMFTTPAKPVEKIATNKALTQSTPEIIEREVPPLEPENKAEKAANKLKQRAAKFDDLFADSDDEEDGDIFSSQPTKSNVASSEPVSVSTDREVKNASKPAMSSVDNARQPQTDKIKARSAKFDDLFADSDDEDGVDIFAGKNVEDTQKTKPGNKTSEPDILAANNKSADISTSEENGGTRSPETKSSSQSNIAKLQNNLNLSPDMLMGGPRPRKPKNTENSSDETDKVEGEKITKEKSPKVDKFDDLFGNSDDEDDIFAEKTNKPPKTKDEEFSASTSKPASNSLFDSDTSPTIPESSTTKSNVAKLQSNLNISPEMLMGGPRPKKPKEPEVIEEPKSDSIDTKTKARAAKFDDLFDGSDEEDMFSVPELPKSQDKPEISQSATQADSTEPSSPAKVSGSNNEDKIKQRAAKFDDLFGDSDEDSEDIFAAEEKKNPRPVLSEEKSEKPESPIQSAVEPDSGPVVQKSKASPNSNIAKLQNNLKFNPAMLMGGPRPPVHKQKEPSQESVSEADKPTNGDQEAGKTGAEPQNPKVLSSITKGRTKRGGRRPPSRAPNRTTTSSQPTPTSFQPTEGTESNSKPGSVADSAPTLKPTSATSDLPDKSEKQEDILAEPKKPIIEEEDIFETPSLKFDDEDDIFATPSKTKPSRQKIAVIEDDDLFSALPEKKSSILEDDAGEEDDLFSTPTKSKSSNKKKSNAAEDVSTTSSSKVKEKKEEEDELFSAPAKSRDQGKKKGKTKKILDDDLFGDDFDLFSDISAKPKQGKKDKKGTKAKKSEGSKSKDFIDPLFQ